MAIKNQILNNKDIFHFSYFILIYFIFISFEIKAYVSYIYVWMQAKLEYHWAVCKWR